jgi:hypothetical protein
MELNYGSRIPFLITAAVNDPTIHLTMKKRINEKINSSNDKILFD